MEDRTTEQTVSLDSDGLGPHRKEGKGREEKRGGSVKAYRQAGRQAGRQRWREGKKPTSCLNMKPKIEQTTVKHKCCDFRNHMYSQLLPF